MLKPIILCGTGRCGTTLLMQLLATSDKFFIPSDYPFESRFLYYLEALATMSTKDNSTQLVRNTILEDPALKDLYSRGLYHPFKLRKFVDHKVLRVELFKNYFLAFSKSILNRAKRNSGLLYYAEKSMGFILPDIFSHIQPTIIHIIRDPRDILTSVMQFNQKRGFPGFAWVDSDTPLSYAKKMIPMYRVMLNKGKVKHDQEFSVKYEEMVLHEAQMSALLKKRLNIDINYKNVSGNIDQYRQHMTSETAVVSVGRWRKELDKSVLDLFDSELGELLTASGYELNG